MAVPSASMVGLLLHFLAASTSASTASTTSTAERVEILVVFFLYIVFSSVLYIELKMSCKLNKND